MNRIEYLEKTIKKTRLTAFTIDNSIIYALILALTPEEACSFFDLSFEQNFQIRHWVLRKISSDIAHKYEPFHKELVSQMLIKVEDKKFRKKESCAFSLNALFDSLPKIEQEKVLDKFLNSIYKRQRDRGYKKLRTNWNKKYQKVIERNWNTFKDPYCGDIFIEHFPKNYLMNNYKELAKYLNSYLLSKLFLNIAIANQKSLETLKKIDEIGYAYVLIKLDKKLTNQEAKIFLKKSIKDERIGLLLWCLGKMGLWDTVKEFNENYNQQAI